MLWWCEELFRFYFNRLKLKRIFSSKYQLWEEDLHCSRFSISFKFLGKKKKQREKSKFWCKYCDIMISYGLYRNYTISILTKKYIHCVLFHCINDHNALGVLFNIRVLQYGLTQSRNPVTSKSLKCSKMRHYKLNIFVVTFNVVECLWN